ncbi:MAG TPA: dihydroxyacetone kinase, partial [Cellulomonas sp.]|nr:dihydroxyacetone kinase [Cellulomonas sp.]
REARDSGIRVAVLPTHAQVQGLAALAVHDPDADFEDDVIAMSSAAAYTRHGAVTIATSSGMTMAGPCRAGDVLGIVGGDFAVIGTDLHGVALEVLDRLLGPTTELVTLVVGQDADERLAAELSAHLGRERPDVDTLVYPGGQENYLLFVAAE